MTELEPRLQASLRTGVALGVVGFVVLLGLAMLFYPGGNFWDRGQPGYDLWLNFFCDLLHDPALNGEPNGLSARLASAAMASFALALSCYWVVVGTLIPNKRWASASRAFGLIAALGLLVVTLLPSDVSPTLHAGAVLAAGPIGLGAVLIAMLTLPLPPGFSLAKAFGVGMLLFGVLAVLLYAWQLLPDVQASRLLPVSQKLSTLLAAAWTLAVCRLPWKSEKSS